jgi:hypothetical protein
MRLSLTSARTRAVFDDPNLVSHGGLVPVVALAERCGLPDLLAEHVRPGGECGVNAAAKVGCQVAGMAAGADSIDDMGLLRHGAMACCSAGPAPRPRSGRTCALIPGGTYCSWSRRAGNCWPARPRAPLLPQSVD